MAIRYTCRHCEIEIGTLPFESAKETILLLQKMDEEEDEQFLTYEKDGELTVAASVSSVNSHFKFPGLLHT